MILALVAATTVTTVEVPETAYGHIAVGEIEETIVIPRSETEAIVRDYFSDIPIMAEVSRCESSFTHYLPDGSILQGRVDSADTGVMQINKRYHEASAIAMGLNLDDLYDNMLFARKLYERQGVQPWSASMPCWGNSLAVHY